jgi:hypothetical protein
MALLQLFSLPRSMRNILLNRSLSSVALCASIAVMFLLAGSAYAIRNGIVTNDLPKTVMIMYEPPPMGFTGSALSTVTNISRPRCFLGDAHSFEDANLENLDIKQGQQDPFEKYQDVEDVKIHHQHERFWTDLAVTWVKNKQGGAFMQDPTDYAPIPYGGSLPVSSTGAFMGYGANSALSARDLL